MAAFISYFSEFGFCLKIVQSENSISEISFLKNLSDINDSSDTELHKIVKGQLREYFRGVRKNFDFPLSYSGTDFQKKVWAEIMKIPYGKTISYSELAYRAASPSAIRAVGTACGKNKLLIVVPCHRVIGKNGNITGYAAGLEVKQKLIELENKVISCP